MLSFQRKKKRQDDNGNKAASAAAEPPPQPVSSVLRKLEESAYGMKKEYKLTRTTGQPLGLGLAMDSAESGGRAVIYAVRPNSIAHTVGLPSNTFLTAIDGKSTSGYTLDDVQRGISDAVTSKDYVMLEIAVPADPNAPSAAESAVAALLNDEAPSAAEAAAMEEAAARLKDSETVEVTPPVGVLESPDLKASAPTEAPPDVSDTADAEGDGAATTSMPPKPRPLAPRRSVSFIGMPPTEPDTDGVQALVAMSSATPGEVQTFSFIGASSLGILLAPDSKGRAVIYAVREGSTAEARGIMAPCFLVAVNGTKGPGFDKSAFASDSTGVGGVQRLLVEALTNHQPIHLDVSMPLQPGEELKAAAAKEEEEEEEAMELSQEEAEPPAAAEPIAPESPTRSPSKTLGEIPTGLPPAPAAEAPSAAPTPLAAPPAATPSTAVHPVEAEGLQVLDAIVQSEPGVGVTIVISGAKSLGFALALDARGRTVLYAVRKDSVADQHGVAAPSFLMMFNGTSTAGMSLSAVQSGLFNCLKSSDPMTLTLAPPVDAATAVALEEASEKSALAAGRTSGASIAETAAAIDAANLKKRVSFERQEGPPGTPGGGPSNAQQPPATPPTPASGAAAPSPSPRLSIQPSFPKAQYNAGHAELRAGLRLLSPKVGDNGNGEGEQSAVEVRLGLGINTGAGVKDNSVGFKALGCGLQVGQRTGVSFFDNEVVIDFKRLWGGESSSRGPVDGSHVDDSSYSLLSCIQSPSKKQNGVPQIEITNKGSPSPLKMGTTPNVP